MKKNSCFKIIFSFALMFTMFFSSMDVNAAGPSYTAKYSTPTLDGVVRSGEYGSAVDFRKSNLSVFYYNFATDDPTTENANYPNLTYSFAWDESNLYVGITAGNLENISDTQFQIDLSPNKKIKDGQAGIFYTFRVISVGGVVSVARSNYNQGNISKKCATASREVSSGVYNLEVAIPLTELQVSGPNGDFSSLELKSGTWGVGCYMVGNGAGYTNTLGAGNNESLGYDAATGDGDLIQYYNTLTLAEKPASQEVNSTDKQEGSTIDKQEGSTTNKQEGSTTDKQEGNTNTEDVTDLEGNVDTEDGTKPEEDKNSKDDANSEDEKKNSSAGSEANKVVNGNNTLLIICIVLSVLIVFGAVVTAILILKKKPVNSNK